MIGLLKKPKDDLNLIYLSIAVHEFSLKFCTHAEEYTSKCVDMNKHPTNNYKA